MVLRHGPAAWSYGMVLQHGPAAWSPVAKPGRAPVAKPWEDEHKTRPRPTGSRCTQAREFPRNAATQVTRTDVMLSELQQKVRTMQTRACDGQEPTRP